jgi:Flp pilus assembly pilin Flp
MTQHSDQKTTALSRMLRRLRRDEGGATAIEFGIVAIPFLMLVFGIVAVGLYFFTAFSMEHAVEQAARQIRTCSFRSANAGLGMTTREFKETVCSFAPKYVDCGGKVRVHVINIADETSGNPGGTGFSGASLLPACTQVNGNLVTENTNTTTRVTAAANSIALVSVCYQFDLVSSIPFIKLGNMSGSNSNEAALIRAATTFRVEPCN